MTWKLIRLPSTAELCARGRSEIGPASSSGPAHTTRFHCRLSPAVESWRRTAAGQVPVEAPPLFDLVPPRGQVPDFVTPEVNGMDSGTAAERLLATPAAVLERQLSGLRRRPLWVRRLCSGDRAELRRLARAVRAYHAACFASAWPSLRPVLVAELTRCMELLVECGTEAVLRSRGPAIRWRDGARGSPVTNAPAICNVITQ